MAVDEPSEQAVNAPAIPAPPALEDQPAWYTLLRRVQVGEQLDPTTLQLAAGAALADHDWQASQLASLHHSHS